MYKLLRLFFFAVLLQCTSCAYSDPAKIRVGNEVDPSCNVALLNGTKEQLGTVFKLQVGTEVAYITAAHSLPTNRTLDLTMTFKCNKNVVRQRIISIESLPGVDAALIRPANGIAEMPTLRAGVPRIGAINIPNYPNMSNLDPRLSEVAIDSAGSIFLFKEGKVYFTSQTLRPGASGAPLIGFDGLVLGILTGRYMEGGTYAGIGYGDSIEKILLSISSRNRSSSNSNSTSKLL
jgi:hypothetical protein